MNGSPWVNWVLDEGVRTRVICSMRRQVLWIVWQEQVGGGAGLLFLGIHSMVHSYRIWYSVLGQKHAILTCGHQSLSYATGTSLVQSTKLFQGAS